MQILWDFLRHGIPTVTTVTATTIAVNQNKTSTVGMIQVSPRFQSFS